MNRTLLFFKKYRWALLSGVLMGTSYIPLPPWANAFCWVPLWWDLITNTRSLKEAFIKGWWTQFLLTLIGFHWISHVAHEFAFFPWPIAIATLFLFAALAHLYIPVAAVLAVWLRGRFALSAGVVAVLLACFQNLGEAFWPSIFSWNLGYPLLWIHSGWAQWGDVIGFLGLSFLVHLINSQLTWALLNRKSRKAWMSVGVTALLVAALGLTGLGRGDKWQGQDSFKATLVQANIGNLEKIYAEKGVGYQRSILERYFSLSRQAVEADPGTQLLIWPESAVPEYLDAHNTQRRYAQLFFDGVRDVNRDLFTGAYSNDTPETRPREDYNGIFLFDGQGRALGPSYHKTNLLIFGEYAPLGHLFPILRKWNPGGEGFGRGSGPMTYDWQGLKIGPQICYDSLYPNFSRNLTLQGADVMINLTNDSWFGPRFEPEQHLYMTLARAIENRRPLLRSTNTGISTVIEATGFEHVQSPKFQEWFHTYEVKYLKNAGLTFYTRFGAFLSLIPLLVVGLLLGINARGTSRLERNSH